MAKSSKKKWSRSKTKIRRADVEEERIALLKRIRKDVEESLRTEDRVIIESVHTTETIDKIINLFYERLEEWARMYCPQLKYQNMEQLVKRIETEINLPLPARLLLEDIEKLMNDKERLMEDIKTRTKMLCPNMTYLIGEELTAKMLASAGSLERLARFPASTIQVLGAEKALFKHLRKGTKPPKHGLLFQYHEINRAPKKLRGKIARAIASKITVAVKADAITKHFISDKLKEQMDEQIKRILRKAKSRKR